MIKLHDISIRNKLVLMLVFTSLLVLGIFFIIFIVTDIKDYKKRKVDAMISMAQVIGTNSISTLEFDDNEAAKQILSELHNVAPEIVHAGIIDKSGKLFASYTKPGADSLSVPADLDSKKSLFGKDNLYVSNDIIDNNEILGKVVLEIELSELSKIKQSRYEIATILLFSALGFSFLIAIAIQSYISKRLLYVVNTMKDVSKTGDYDQSLKDNGKDEISVLIRVFNDLMQKVKENQQRKDEFIGIASHELKTPLTSIKGYIELLNSFEDREPNKQCVQKALENINKLERLIKDLLDVSKIQSGQLELNMREFNMNQLLDETVTSIQIVTRTHEIVRKDNLANEVIIADKQRIEQVLVNLLSNAIKYSPGEKMVYVFSEKTDSELIIKVKDFGIGIPKDERTNIFERFYRTKDMSVHIAGFGLGLYISRDIIKRHNGRIWVEGEEKGTTFYFSLPLKASVNIDEIQPGNNHN